MAQAANLPSMLVDSPPDIMNDPQYATNMTEGDDGAVDVDTCRICRGEGTETEPLFHPCKCSGSIKYVHQDCLMEWLSHSQKKHCELCKTPFRFTKLYSPNMPKSLPTVVFFRHFLMHSARNIGNWLRFCLVSTVWLGCLPWVIRQVWWLLFWFSDGGWGGSAFGPGNGSNVTSHTLEMARNLELAIMTGNGTSPVTPLSAAQTTSANMGVVVEAIVGIFKPFSSTMNLNASDPLISGFMKSLFLGFGVPFPAIVDEPFTNTSDPRFLSILAVSAANRSTLLSEVSFLKNLTRSEIINNMIVSIAEGYIITFSVVVCFILVFLIREWVVQQQPGINMGAGFNAEFPGDRQRDQVNPEERQVAQARIGRLGVNVPAEQRDAAQLRVGRLAADNPELRDVADRPIAQHRRRNFDANPMQRLEEEIGDYDADTERDESTTLTRPISVRDALSSATDIQRQLTEAPPPRMTEEFLAIWRRAKGAPEDVLRIIEEEHKGEDLQYWVNAMEHLKEHLTPHSSGSTALGSTFKSTIEDSSHSNGSGFPTSTVIARAEASGGSIADIRKENLIWNSNLRESEQDSGSVTTSNGKGKAKAESKELSLEPASQQPRLTSDWWDQGLDPFERVPTHPLTPTTNSRPRATSDGPRIKESISPLARGSWTFSEPEEDCESSNTSPVIPTVGPSTWEFGSKFQAKAADNQTFEKSAWEIAQDQRVQNAVTKAREAKEARAFTQDRSGFDPKRPIGASDTVDNNVSWSDSVEVVGKDGITRTYQNVDEMFAANPISESEFESDQPADPEPNPFASETHLPPPREPIVQRPPEPHGFLGGIVEFLWGNNGERQEEDQGANDEHVVHDIAAEAPFIPVAHRDPFEQPDVDGAPEQDREVAEAAIAAGLDPNDADAIDEAEDFEGIMELIGMRGPLFSLVQNALFCMILLGLTVAFGVWIPYNIGRVYLLLAANPGTAFKLPLRLTFWCAAFMQDLAASAIGLVSYCSIMVISLPLRLFSTHASGAAWAAAALRLSHDAFNRIFDETVTTLINFNDSDIFMFSAASHEALLTLKYLVIDSLDTIGRNVIHMFTGDYEISLAGTGKTVVDFLMAAYKLLLAMPAFLAKPDTWVISLEVAKRSTPLDLELSVWDGYDRLWATLAGYAALCSVGALYVKKGSPFSTGPTGRDLEANIIDVLHQAGGVMKVILIISIEMLVFPLYCGLLLDAALLPLFEEATIVSRILFTFNSPMTSIFVHWFVGTCYMFHFALFVSMCRKIMRRGVLYFIRDPDDPTFHPVRDVLERNVATQLRKILFSALVYGALVVVCLGGVVWSLSFASNGVLPIHWSSNEPVLEFPIDLLFYNFLMPVAVKFFKPSDGLHTMYSWWFRQCARALRLTWFMFDERRLDEEGQLVGRTWRDTFRRATDDTLKVKADDPRDPLAENHELAVYFRQSGRYVRAPASDQVRIPKGTPIFLHVDEFNHRLDGKEDRPDGVHGSNSDLYKQIYIPPHFRLRICIFIVSIWIFAALTGVCITIVPLVFGRMVFAKIIPSHVRKNDVYAFSIGIYILGSALYAVFHIRSLTSYIATSLALSSETPRNVVRRGFAFGTLVTRVLWTYGAFLFLLPTLFAFLVELYVILPLHTYFVPDEPHTIHFVQSWTLGLLYVKLTSRIILIYPDSRPAMSLRAVVRHGFLNPDAWLATRSFILPASFSLGLAIGWPWLLARIALMTVYNNSSEEKAVLVYRYAYPAVLAAIFCVLVLFWLARCIKGWRMRIRDEVYLIGERLHNFGERKSGTGVNVVGVRRIET